MQVEALRATPLLFQCATRTTVTTIDIFLFAAKEAVSLDAKINNNKDSYAVSYNILPHNNQVYIVSSLRLVANNGQTDAF